MSERLTWYTMYVVAGITTVFILIVLSFVGYMLYEGLPWTLLLIPGLIVCGLLGWFVLEVLDQ